MSLRIAVVINKQNGELLYKHRFPDVIIKQIYIYEYNYITIGSAKCISL